MKQKKTCCRSTPRCAGCPVLQAQRRKHADLRSDTLADLFSEIYAGRSRAPVPASVTDALAALSLARQPRLAALRDAQLR